MSFKLFIFYLMMISFCSSQKSSKSSNDDLKLTKSENPSNLESEGDEVFDSSTLISSVGGRKRIYCFKREDGGLGNMKIKNRRKRYAIEGSYWGVRQISYNIRRASQVLPEKIVKRVIRSAFDVWETQSPLKFVYKPRGRTDIEILFAKGAHGDGEPFDGQGRILAHAFFPRYGGDVHFDASEHWSPNKYGNGLDLYAVAVHEIGHSLGLKHSQESAAIMAPFYQTYTGESLHLHQDDVQALKRLYGFGDTLESNEALFTGWQSPPDICDDFKIDAFTSLSNGTVIAFSGEYFYEFGKHYFDSTSPRRIDEAWPGLEGDLDAVITDSDGDSYFFKSDRYWLVNSKGRIYSGYPRRIDKGLTDMPKNIDAGFVWRYDDNAYFFKNDKYWKYSTSGMPPGYPKPISTIFPHLRRPPHRIDAALTLPNGDSFLFSGDQYFKLLPNKLVASPAGFIGSSCVYSFQCPKNSFCHEKVCRTSNCLINNDCAQGEICLKGRVDGNLKFACFPIDVLTSEKMDLCPGGGKPIVGYRGKIETCENQGQCSGRSICNPSFGICCSKLRICPWPKSPVLEGFTHKPLMCQFRGASALSCPATSYCEVKSGFCCTEEIIEKEKKPIETSRPSVGEVRPRLKEAFVGDECSTKTGCAGGAVCICSRPMKDCKCECPKEMGYTVSQDGKSCKRTRRRLKEKCRSDMECQAAFSECTSGGCRCKEGFQRDGTGGCKPVAYKCVNHAEPLKFDNQLVTCVVQKTQRDDEIDLENSLGDNSTVQYSEDSVLRAVKKDKRCPSHYYCVAVFDVPKQPNLYQGFCCPLPQPDIPVCPVGNPHASSSAPNYGCQDCPMDHFCHKDSISSHKEICCPKPCVSPDDIYFENQCYPIAYHGDSCIVAQQCIGKFASSSVNPAHEEVHDMECKSGVCECPKGYLIDNGVCKRVECTVGLKGEPSVNSLGGILRCKKSTDCSQGSMCDPFSKVCCKGINKCPSGFVETGEFCKMDKCQNPSDICIVPKNTKSKICCRREE